MVQTNNWGTIIKDNVPILPYIQQFDNLHAEGNSEWVGRHHTHASESGRCLKVNAEKHTFNCYNCGVGGSVIDYEMDRLGVGFREACESIAEQRDLQLPIGDQSPAEREAYQAQRKQDIDTLSL